VSTRRSIILSCASFAVFGACLILPGALLPVLVDYFGVRLVEAGTVLAAQPAAYLVAVLLAGPLLQRLGLSVAVAASLGTMAIGIAAFGLAPSWPLAGMALFVCGLGLGVMEVGVNTVLIDVGGERRTNVLNFAHLFFGVGSFAAPLLATHAVELGISWRWPFMVTALVTAGVGGAWLMLRQTTLPAAPSQPDALGSPRIDLPRVLLLATLLAVYVGVETGVGGWLTKYLTTVRQVSIASAGNVLALYWLGLTAVRLVLTFTAHHVRDEWLVVALSAVVTAALPLALLAGGAVTIAIAFTITGMGLSGIFPAVIAIGGRTHPDAVPRVTSMLIAGAGAGNIVIPWVMSAIADRTDVALGMVFYVAMALVMLALALTLAATRLRSGTS
jgi:fucose permease